VDAGPVGQAEARDAADAALAERAGDVKRVDDDQRAAPLMRRVEEVDALAKDTEAAAKTLADLDAALLAERAALAQATERLHAARTARDAARAAHDEHIPHINAAERLGATLDAVRTERDADAKKLEDAEAERDAAVTARDDASSHLETARPSLDGARKALEPLAPLATLARDLPLIERDAEALGDLSDSVEDLRARVTRREESAGALSSEHQALTRDLECAEEELAPFRDRVAHAEQALSRALGDAEDARARRRAINERIEALDAPVAAIEEVLRRHDELKERQAEITQADTDRAYHAEQHGVFRAKRDGLLEKIAQREDTRREQRGYRDKIQQMLALADTRKELVDGAPCPLCGPTEHPTGHDAREAHERELEAERDELDARMEKVIGELRDLEAERLEVERSVTTHEAGANAAEERIMDARTRLADILARYNGARHRASLDAIDVFPEATPPRRQLREDANRRRGDLKGESIRLHNDLQDLDRRIDDVRDAQDQLREQRTEAERLKEGLAKLSALAAERERELEEERKRLDAAIARQERAYHEIRTKLEAAHVDAPEDADVVDLLELARSRRDAHTLARAHVDALEAAVAEHTKAARDASVRAEELGARAQELASSVAERDARIAELDAERAALLGEHDPSSWRSELTTLMEETREQAEALEQSVGRAAEACAQLTVRHEERTRELGELTEKFERAQAELDSALERAGLGDVEDLSSLVLREDERMTLHDAIAALREAAIDAKRELERTEHERAEHRALESELTSGDDDARDLEAWGEVVAAQDRVIEEVLERRGAVQKTLDEHERAARKAADFKEELIERRRIFGTWETINKLIGVRDGDAFKRFAQSLNLQELVDRANIRLGRLAPRYQLAVARGEMGEPKLDFVVRDGHHANFERPLTTLSGGETFLVSLALALALSDFKRLEMPIETLLLDEGFGTLDQDTLDTAMSTLRQLQRESNRQIGIISHVEMLKERIDTRILVEPRGNGRSTLSVQVAGDDE